MKPHRPPAERTPTGLSDFRWGPFCCYRLFPQKCSAVRETAHSNQFPLLTVPLSKSFVWSSFSVERRVTWRTVGSRASSASFLCRPHGYATDVRKGRRTLVNIHRKLLICHSIVAGEWLLTNTNIFAGTTGVKRGLARQIYYYSPIYILFSQFYTRINVQAFQTF